MDKNILYIGVELEEESKELLKEKFGEQDGWKIYCHHMTSIFNSGKTELTDQEKIWFEKNKKKSVFLIVTHFGINDKVAAVRVMCEAPSRNKYKHITLGVNIEKGGKPVESNYISNWTLTEPMILIGKVKFWYRKKS